VEKALIARGNELPQAMNLEETPPIYCKFPNLHSGTDSTQLLSGLHFRGQSQHWTDHKSRSLTLEAQQTMKRILPSVAMLAVLGSAIGSSAQHTASPSATPGQEGAPPQQETDAATPQQSARSFEGKISTSGEQYVLLDRAAQTSYRLDDQKKAKKYAGKEVKVMATMDPVSNVLHVIDITPASKP
jgi:hypothetical protein